MANPSIYAAFERMWQHIVLALGGKADKTDIAQSDMSQNDESAPDYVKNRTHWTETVETTLLSNQSFTAEDLFEIGFAAIMLPTDVMFVDGSTYIFTINSVEYSATCRPNTADGVARLILGNLAVLGVPSDGIDTECPFLIVTQDDGEGGFIAGMVISPDVVAIGDTITLSIAQITEEVHQIDQKFIPTTHWVEYTGEVILEETTLNFTFSENINAYIAPLPEGIMDLFLNNPIPVCNVIWDGKNYLCQYYRDMDMVAILPPNMSPNDNIINDGTIFPFLISGSLLGETVWTRYSGSHTLAITTCKVHQINDAYIPDSISRVGRSGGGDHSEIFNDYVDSTASGQYAHSEGYITHADGVNSHAEGGSTQASGDSAHAEGCATVANGDYSHAEGWDTQANGEGSHAEGVLTIASSDYQHVQGFFNIEDSTNKYAHIVGNGLNRTNRSNAHTLDWSGNAWFAGEIKVGGTGQDDAEAKTLATTEYVDSLIGSVLTASY